MCDLQHARAHSASLTVFHDVVARRQEELQDHGGSATAVAAQEAASARPAAQSDARATLKGALGELIDKGNSLPAAQVEAL